MTTPVKFVSGERRVRNHRKSRAGCYRCKAKRIKCSEAKPQCTSCLKHAVQCIYPDKQSPTPPTQINLIQPNPFGYNLKDMRLFHDFMTISYPHLPLESDEAWLRDVPIIAQQHEFLMHGILALGAAHLHSRTNLELKETVDRHRYLAMQGLNSRGLIESSPTTQSKDETGNRLTALLATAYVLTFTASYMGDPLSLCLVLVRACASISGQIVHERLASPLLPWNSRSATAEPHLEVMRRRLRKVEPLPPQDIREGVASLVLVERECSFMPFQWDIFQVLKAVFEHIEEPYEGTPPFLQRMLKPLVDRELINLLAYFQFVQMWNAFASMSPTDFAVFTNVENKTSVVLQAHFLALEALLKPWLLTEVKKDNAQRVGLTALPASATLSAPGLQDELVRWPLSVLGKQAKLSQATIGK